MDATSPPSTRPYLLRAMYDWCNDCGFTPHVVVRVDQTVQVPREYVQNNQIVLNISERSTSHLQLGNDYLSFKARFGGRSLDVMVPINRVLAIYAQENGQGMEFPPPAPDEPAPALLAEGGAASPAGATLRALSPVQQREPNESGERGEGDEPGLEPPPPPPTAPRPRPALKVVK